MTRIKLGVKYQDDIERERERWSTSPHPTFDSDDEVEDFLRIVFRKLWKFWDRDYLVDGKLTLPPFKNFVTMMEFGSDADNDLRSTLFYYLDSFFPFVPTDERLRKIDRHQKQDEGVLTNRELYYVAGYIIDQHEQ
jgi:hypothetical protein